MVRDLKIRNDRITVLLNFYVLAVIFTDRYGRVDDIRDNFPKYVVSMDEFDFSRNGIKHKNIREFLLMKEWN